MKLGVQHIELDRLPNNSPALRGGLIEAGIPGQC